MPSIISVAKGQTERLVAMATYSDNSSSDVTNSVTWRALDMNVATVTAEGLLTGIEIGNTTVTAFKNGITSNLVNVEVTEAVITGISVTPSLVSVAKGQTQLLEAIATYSDNSSSNISDSVTWKSMDTSITTVTPEGLLTGVKIGGTTVTAFKNGVTSNTVNVTVTEAVITDISVTPSNVTVAKGQTQPLVAIASYSDGTSSDVTQSVTWVSTTPEIATVTPVGLLTGVDLGSTNVTVFKHGVTSNTVNITVTEAVITEINVTPSVINLAKGQIQSLTAMAIYSDGSSSNVSDFVSWIPIDTAIATVSSTGLVTGIEVGSTTITAFKHGVTSNTVNVTVTAAVITDIKVTPSSVNIAKGETQLLTAMATYSDGRLSDISNFATWISVAPMTATVTSTGLLTGVDLGSTSVTAFKHGITSNTVNITVTEAVITEINVTPSVVNVAKGQAQALTAMAIYSDGTSSNLSNSVTWASAQMATATVTSSGLVTGVELGTTTVTAFKNGVSSEPVNVTVTPAVITEINITPSVVNIGKYQTQLLVAMATYSDGSSSDISSSVTWLSQDMNIATVTSLGLLTAVDIGNTTLTATKNDIVSNVVSVEVCSLAGACLDIFDTGSGKLFTNSPSVAYLDSIGGSDNDGTRSENGTDGPAGEFYRFRRDNAAVLCDTYNTQNIAGRSNWRLATRDELREELYDIFGNMFVARGWPTRYSYWTGTPVGSSQYRVKLNDGEVTTSHPTIRRYASCVSVP